MNPLGLDPLRFWVAVSRADGGVLGVVQLQEVQLGQRFTEVRSMVVGREHRNLGVGRALLSEAMASLPEDEPVWLTTVPRSASFYARHGFEPVYDTTELPTTVWFERFAGQFVARAVGAGTCVAMRRAGDRVRKTVGARGYERPGPDGDWGGPSLPGGR